MAQGDKRRHTPEFRGSYVHLAKPSKIDEDSDPRYSILIVLDEDDDDQMDYLESLEDWIQEVAEEEWGDVPKRLKMPIREGGDFDSDDFEGKVVLNVSSARKPGIVDSELEAIDEMDQAQELYSGAWYKVSIRPYAWNHKTGGKGVSFALDNVMKIRDDEPLGGSAPRAEDDFADMKSAGRKKSRKKGRR